MTGSIYNISRMRMGSDGPGMSTLVALKGCRLKCSYCLNEKCHEPEDGEIDPAPAYAYTSDELITELKKDGMYFSMTGGGIVFGGGEPLLQAEFIKEVCEKIPDSWKIRVETSLNVNWERISKLTKYINLWIVDIKDMNPDIYRKYTGFDNEQMIENLYKLVNAVGCEKVHVRVPHIPEFNTNEDVKKSANYIRDKICIEPEIFTYTVKTDQKATFHAPLFYTGADFTEDRNCQEFLRHIISDKENFLAHTSEYLKKNSSEEGISWEEDCYRMLYAEIYVFARAKGYYCSDEEIQRIIDAFLASINEIDDDSMLWYSLKIKIKEQLRANFNN